MKISDKIKCVNFPCADVDKDSYIVPPAEIEPAKIKILMITEAPPNDIADYFYTAGSPFYLQTTLQAFKDAGADVNSCRISLTSAFTSPRPSSAARHSTPSPPPP